MATSGLSGTALAPGALARLLADSTVTRARMDRLTAQAADGRRGDLYGDLGSDAARAISLRGEIARRDAHGTSLGRALGRAEATGAAMVRLSTLTTDFIAEAGKMTRGDVERLTTLAAGARAALGEVATLLNERHDGEFLFGGSDVGNPPIPGGTDLMATGMGTQIAAAVAGLGANAATVNAATMTAAASNAAGTTPFSAYLSDPARGLTESRRTTLVEDGDSVPTGLFANRNAAVTSSGETTGSWSRDLMRGLMTLASLTPGQATSGADLDGVLAGVRGALKAAASGLASEEGALGMVESRLESARARHADLGTVLSGQLAAVEEVDLAATLTELSDTKTRLEASWKALAMLSELSLTNFLR